MLSIVVVNWNGERVIKPLIECLIKAKKELGNWLDIVIVDNASSDNSVEIIRELNGVNLIESTNNLGFAGGCNLGAINSRHPFILFLNPDTMVSADTLVQAVDYLMKPSSVDIGILGIQLRDERGNISRSSARFPRSSMFIAQNLGLDRLFPAVGHAMKEWDHRSSRAVDQVIGAFYLIRRDLLIELGGFDERFFVYFEEVDLAYRARKSGYQTYFLSELYATHTGGGTTSQIRGTRLFYSLRSRLLYGRKHFGYFENLINFANTLLLEPISRTLFLTLQGRMSEISDLKEGFVKLYRNLPKILLTPMKP